MPPRSAVWPGFTAWFLHSLAYQAQCISASGFGRKLVVLVTISVCNVGLGAALYKTVSGVDWATATFTVYGVLYRAPGFSVSRGPTALATLVLNSIFIFGVFVFAVVIGTISDEIKSQMKAVRTGSIQLQLCHHILLLNWNSLTIPILHHLAAAQRNQQHPFYRVPVVVLANKPKADMVSMHGPPAMRE